MQIGPLEHELPPIISPRWWRVTFIVTSGDRFMEALEINDLFEQESPAGQLYVRLKELGIPVEREWLIDEEGIAYDATSWRRRLHAWLDGAWSLPVCFAAH